MSTEFYFAEPLWFIATVCVIAWFIFTHHKPLHTPHITQAIQVFYPLLNALKQPQKTTTEHNSRFAFSLIIVLLSISLAQPGIKKAISYTPNQQQNVDLMLVVNTSVSMVLRDYQEPDKHGILQQFDRMEKTKRILQQLVSRFKGQRIGLVILGRPAAVWLPLTSDMEQIQFAIQHLKTTLGGRTNDIGASLQLVAEQFETASTYQQKVLLVNDGYLQLGSTSPLHSIRQLAQRNITVHTLAIGSPQRPEYSLGVGHLIYSPVDLSLMRSLAKAGNGKMIHAWKNQTVDELLAAIDQPITQNSNTTTQIYSTALYAYPLSLATGILLFVFFPSLRFTRAK